MIQGDLAFEELPSKNRQNKDDLGVNNLVRTAHKNVLKTLYPMCSLAFIPGVY